MDPLVERKMKHNHHQHCSHTLAFCVRCDRPYCTACGKEWYEQQTSSWYTLPNTWQVYPTTTNPYIKYASSATSSTLDSSHKHEAS